MRINPNTEEAKAVVITYHSEKLDELSSNNDTVTNQQEYYLMMIQWLC